MIHATGVVGCWKAPLAVGCVPHFRDYAGSLVIDARPIPRNWDAPEIQVMDEGIAMLKSPYIIMVEARRSVV